MAITTWGTAWQRTYTCRMSATSAITEQAISNRLRSVPLDLAREQVERMARFLSLLSRWNEVHNLTAMRSAEQLVERNVIECLALRPWLRGWRIADIGSGAGLPGIPLAIAEPERRFTLIESRSKRIYFLRHAIGELGLENVRAEHSRAEDLPAALAFDTVLARAVAPPRELLEWARHLTVAGGVLLLLTSEDKARQLVNLAEDFELKSLKSAQGQAVRCAVLERIDVRST
jgi:16S rRNA (guanine527-N7)-methyltransferase